MRKETRKLYKQAYEKWGQSQFTMATEELCELILAMSKLWRQPSSQNADNVVEEIADAGIMIEQLQICFNCESAVGRMRRRKLRRLKKLLRRNDENKSNTIV